MTVVPYKDKQSTKKQQVEKMFDNISARYDLLNTVLSAGIDKGWRKKALTCLKDKPLNHLLDVATGTGEFALEAHRLLKPKKITGVDISKGMLRLGIEKIKKLQLQNKITLQKADSERLPFADCSFDAAVVAFGVRNFENLESGLKDIYRVLQPGSKFVVLEFSKPQNFFVAKFYQFYSKYVLPLIGKTISKDNKAYTYLPESVQAFPAGEQFIKILLQCGFSNASAKPLSFGIVTVYTAAK